MTNFNPHAAGVIEVLPNFCLANLQVYIVSHLLLDLICLVVDLGLLRGTAVEGLQDWWSFYRFSELAGPCCDAKKVLCRFVSETGCVCTCNQSYVVVVTQPWLLSMMYLLIGVLCCLSRASWHKAAADKPC